MERIHQIFKSSKYIAELNRLKNYDKTKYTILLNVVELLFIDKL